MPFVLLFVHNQPANKKINYVLGNAGELLIMFAGRLRSRINSYRNYWAMVKGTECAAAAARSSAPLTALIAQQCSCQAWG